MIDTCPHCHKKLISHASPRCNWCGCEIDDPSYVKEAEVRRDTYHAEQAAHDAAALMRWEVGMATNVSPYAYGFGTQSGVLGGIASAYEIARRERQIEANAAMEAQALAEAAATHPPHHDQPTPEPADPIDEEAERLRHLEI